jgi:hypothetical protein
MLVDGIRVVVVQYACCTFFSKELSESGCLCEDLGFRLRIAGKILGHNGNYAIVRHFLYAEDILF